MSERNAFVLFFIGIAVFTIGLVAGLRLLGTDDETLAGAVSLLLPVVGLSGGFLFMRYH
jgi:hypothetical protein